MFDEFARVGEQRLAHAEERFAQPHPARILIIEIDVRLENPDRDWGFGVRGSACRPKATATEGLCGPKGALADGSGLATRDSGLATRDSGRKEQVSGVGAQVSEKGVPDDQSPSPGKKSQTPDTRHLTPDTSPVPSPESRVPNPEFVLTEEGARQMETAFVELDSCREQSAVKDGELANCQEQVAVNRAVVGEMNKSVNDLNQALRLQDEILARVQAEHRAELKAARGARLGRFVRTLQYIGAGVVIGVVVAQ